MSATPAQLVYNPGVFETPDIEAAKAIILTPEIGTTTEERWRLETPYLIGQMLERQAIGANWLVIDYGCCIGRLS